MLTYARTAVRIVNGRSEAEFVADEILVLAASRAVEIIGEAAYQTSAVAQNAFTGLPWRDVIAMRHKYVHGYRTILPSILHQTISRDLPPLIGELERLLNEGPRTDGA